MPAPRSTLAKLRRSIACIESVTSAPESLGGVLDEVLTALRELEEVLVSGRFATSVMAPETRRLLELVRESGTDELTSQREVTASLEALARSIERRLVPTGEPAPIATNDVAANDVEANSATVNASETPQQAPAVEPTDQPQDQPDEITERPAGASSEPPRAEPATVDEDPDSTFAASIERCVALLGAVLRANPSRIAPELDWRSPLGHSYPFAAEILGTDARTTATVLEELSDLGLLQRLLENRVHSCPTCDSCHVNFREQCPRCDSLDLKVERVLHHFRCGYSGIESEFGGGLDLACPKCRRELFQLGQDFDRPHETYVCRECDGLFEEPRLSGQCLACASEFPAHRATQTSIHAYLPTPLTIRAVELGRLTGLDVDSILYDAELKIATRDFLEFEIKRELVRLSRHATAFSTAALSFERGGRAVPIFREWSASSLRELCVTLADSLRTLDLVTRLDAERIGILMPEADGAGAEVVRNRLFGLLDEMAFVDRGGNDLVPTWNVATWAERKQPFDDVQRFLFPPEATGRGAVR